MKLSQLIAYIKMKKMIYIYIYI